MGIRRSWLATAVVRNTSPMPAPLRLKPPHVPALMSKSGGEEVVVVIVWRARKVATAAGTVPTLSTPEAFKCVQVIGIY